MTAPSTARRSHSTLAAILLTLLVLVLPVLQTPATAQSSSVLASGLLFPTRVALTPAGEVLVAEGGTFTPNQGRLSVLDPDTGARRTLIDGLPAGPEAQGTPQGPSALAFTGDRSLLVAFGGADVTVPGDSPGSEDPNPQGPSSPIMSSLVTLQLSADIADITDAFTLTLDDHFTIANGRTATVTNAAGQTASLTLVHDYRDLVRDPFINARRTNPFGITLDNTGLPGDPLTAGPGIFVVDSSQNSLERVDLPCGRNLRVLEFPPVANPLPFGPPFTEAVPTAVRTFRGAPEGGASESDLLVALETGFPFAQGVASVLRVDPQSGATAPFITGLTQALDLQVVRSQGETDYYVVELSLDLLSGAPGRLLRFTDPAGPPQVLADDLLGPTSVAVDVDAEVAYVTEIFVGGVRRVTLP